MAKQAKEKPKETYDLGKYLADAVLYQDADVALRLASNKETAQFAVGGLEALFEKLEKELEKNGLDKRILSGAKLASLSSKEGVNTAVGVYGEQYRRDALGMLRMPDFYTLRLNEITSILGEEKAKAAKAVFDKYKEKTIGSIKQEVEQANEILESKSELYDEKQKEKANETLTKLMPIYNLIELFEQKNYDNLMPNAKKRGYERMATDFLSKA
ncbi:MAG: hypothetical protein Q7S06_01105 [Nanoarchaeota archaeon]|nr:hypothetical protein [Nanoarchaeota archaeon]